MRWRRRISTEVELKLAAPAVYLPELKRALLEMASPPTSSSSRLISTYYDTPDLALKRRGMSLRVREQDGRFIQTVKKANVRGNDLLSRGEWEDELPENCPDPQASHSRDHLPEGISENLRPLFATDVTRTSVAIELAPATRIEAAIDEGEIRAAGRNGGEPISEVELELSSGDAAALYEVAMRLLEVAPIQIEPHSKAERGYRLDESAPGEPPVVRAAPVLLDPIMSVEAALQEIGRACLSHLLHNEAAARLDQPEGVHQMRVALRRIRSATSSFKELLPARDRRWISSELGWLNEILGSARNLDVFASDLLQPALEALSDEAGIDDLAVALDEARRTAYDRVAQAIHSERHAAEMLRLSHWIEARAWRKGRVGLEERLAMPIRDLAPHLLDQRWRNLRKRSKDFRRLTARQRHKLRIAAKKLRYTIELLESLFDRDELEAFVTHLKRLQDDLGYANDLHVAHDLLPGLSERAVAWRAVMSAGGHVLEWHEKRLARGERKLRKRIRRLNRAAPFWRTRKRGAG